MASASPARRARAIAVALLAAASAACQGGGGAPRPTPVAIGGWRAGDARRYAVDLESEARVGPDTLTQFRVRVAVTLTALEVEGGRALIHAAPADVHVTSTLAPLAPKVPGLERQLEQPFLFELGPGGAVPAYHFSDEPSPTVVGIRRALYGALRVERRAGPKWTAEEDDATGTYDAEYTALGQANLFSKRKLRYTRLIATGAEADPATTQRLAPQVVRSEQRLRLDDGGAVDTIHMEETLRAGTGAMLPVETVTRLDMSTASRERLPPERLAPLRLLLVAAVRHEAAAPWLPPSAAREESAQVEAARIGARTLPQVLAQLRRLARQPDPTDKAVHEARDRERADLLGALEAMIRTRPTTVPALVQRIDKRDPIALVLLDALGSSGSVEAQRALADITRHRKLDQTAVRVAAIALSRTPRPSQVSVDGLIALLDVPGLRIQALYGLGTATRRLREAGDEVRAGDVLQVILARLRSAGGAVETITALRAVANSGHERAFGAVEPYLQAHNADVRASAVEALQLMHHPQADAAIARRLAGEPEKNVRLAAARAARLRAPGPDLEAAVSAAAHGDANPYVRLGALRALVAWLPARPTLRADVQQIADGDAEQAIRAEAQSALAGRPG